MHKIIKIIKRVEGGLILGISFVTPLFFLPIFQNLILTPKLIILTFGVLTLLSFFLIRMILGKKLELNIGSYDLPLFIILITTFLSAILKTPNKMEAFFLPGTASITILLTLLYFFINQTDEKIKKKIPFFIYHSGVLVSIFSLLVISRVLEFIPGLPIFLKNPTFTTLGNNFDAFVFLLPLIPIGLHLTVRERDLTTKIFYYITLLIITLGILVNFNNTLPRKVTTPKFLPTNISWSIAVDAVKVSPLLGMGPGNYLTAFNQFRPITFNQSANWNTKFTGSGSTYLTIMTEAGLFGALGWVLLLFNIVKEFKKDIEEKEKKESTWRFFISPENISLIILVFLLSVSNANLTVFLLFFLLLAISEKSKKYSFNLESQEGGGVISYIPSFLISLPLFLATGYLFLTSTKTIKAEYIYNKAIVSISKNDGKGAYELLSQAISQNPMVDRYHTTAAEIDYSLANSISSKAKGQTISDDEKNVVTQLIQQSIAEGKAAVSLNPTRSGNWLLLSNLYRSIMAFAQGSDKFAIQSLNQTIALDPLDPTLRVSLGGIYFSLGDYDSAIDAFKTAVLAKPDYANARYNLAMAYKEKGDTKRAISEITKVLELVKKDSEDYETAKKELESLNSKSSKTSISQPEVQSPETLTIPVPTIKAEESPLIKLPTEAEPPIISPSPTTTENL